MRSMTCLETRELMSRNGSTVPVYDKGIQLNLQLKTKPSSSPHPGNSTPLETAVHRQCLLLRVISSSSCNTRDPEMAIIMNMHMLQTSINVTVSISLKIAQNSQNLFHHLGSYHILSQSTMFPLGNKALLGKFQMKLQLPRILQAGQQNNQASSGLALQFLANKSCQLDQ